MFENFQDTLNKSDPSETTQTRALRALHNEIIYHRAKDENRTYVQQALGFIPTGVSKSLHKLETLYEAESKNPKAVSREEVVDAVRQDQAEIRKHSEVVNFCSSVLKTSLRLTGGKFCTLGSVGLFAMDSMHPNDNLIRQAQDGLVGAGLGSIAMSYGNNFSNGLLKAIPVAVASGTGHFLTDKNIAEPDPVKTLGPDNTKGKRETPFTPINPLDNHVRQFVSPVDSNSGDGRLRHWATISEM